MFQTRFLISWVGVVSGTNFVLQQWMVGTASLLTRAWESRIVSSLLKHFPVCDWKLPTEKLTSSLLKGALSIVVTPLSNSEVSKLSGAQEVLVLGHLGVWQTIGPESRRCWSLTWSLLLLRGRPLLSITPMPGKLSSPQVPDCPCSRWNEWCRRADVL